MKVRVELEFEMDSLNPENLVKKTPQELVEGLTVTDSDVIDGFELTTSFQDCDNTTDFYIVPNSARIISRENRDFTREQLSVEDMEISDENDSVNSLIGIYLDFDKKFGTNINDDDNAWGNFYATYNPTTDEIDFDIYILRDSPNDSYEDIEYVPSKEEKELVKTLMQEYCQQHEGMSIEELLDTYNEDQSIVGGLE